MEEKKIYNQIDFSDIVTNSILTFEPIVFDEQKKLNYDIKDNLF